MKESKEVKWWPSLNLESGHLSILAEAGSSPLDLTLYYGFLVESKTLYCLMYNKSINQCHGNPVQTTVLKHLQNLGKQLHTQSLTMNPKSECRPPMCLINCHIKPN